MDEPVRIELADPQGQLLEEIADKTLGRGQIARTYAFAMRSQDRVDWPAVNRAIAARWGMTGLTWVKAQAWRLAEAKRRTGAETGDCGDG